MEQTLVWARRADLPPELDAPEQSWPGTAPAEQAPCSSSGTARQIHWLFVPKDRLGAARDAELVECLGQRRPAATRRATVGWRPHADCGLSRHGLFASAARPNKVCGFDTRSSASGAAVHHASSDPFRLAWGCTCVAGPAVACEPSDRGRELRGYATTGAAARAAVLDTSLHRDPTGRTCCAWAALHHQGGSGTPVVDAGDTGDAAGRTSRAQVADSDQGAALMDAGFLGVTAGRSSRARATLSVQGGSVRCWACGDAWELTDSSFGQATANLPCSLCSLWAQDRGADPVRSCHRS